MSPALGRPRHAVRRPVGCPPRRDGPAGHVTRKLDQATRKPAQATREPAQAVPPQVWRRLPESWPGLPCPERPPAALGPAPSTPQRLPKTAPALKGGRHRAVSPFRGWVTRKPAAGPLRGALLTDPGAPLGRRTRLGALRRTLRVSDKRRCLGAGKNQLTAALACLGRGLGLGGRFVRLAGARRPRRRCCGPRSPGGSRAVGGRAGGVTRNRARPSRTQVTRKPGSARPEAGYPGARPPPNSQSQGTRNRARPSRTQVTRKPGRACPSSPGQAWARLPATVLAPGPRPSFAGEWETAYPGPPSPPSAPKCEPSYPEAVRPQTNNQQIPPTPPISHPGAAVI